MYQGALVRTLRIRLRRQLGNLGLLTTALGDVGASVDQISTQQIGRTYSVFDFHLVLDDQEHLDSVLAAIDLLEACDLVAVINSPFALHEGGKIETRASVDLCDLQAFNAAINPGVLEVVAHLDDMPEDAGRFTNVGRTIAIVSDGRGLRGVGRVRSRAMLPLLEAKAALLAQTARLSSLPLVFDIESEDQLVATLKALAPSCSAILLDAIEGGRAQRVTKRLTEELELPVIHDDADAPAIAGLAAVINACRRLGRDAREVTVGQLGLGTAGGAVARLVMRYIGRAVLGEDVHPAAVARHVALGGQAATLHEIMDSCDVIVANTGHGDVISPAMVRNGQAIIALSEPRPEIDPYDATLAGAAFAADGKAINKSVVLPGLFLGALSVGATRIDGDMKIAAAVALADAVVDEGDLMPNPLQADAHLLVACAVARAAMVSGVARYTVPDDAICSGVFRDIVAGRRTLPLRS